MNFIFQRNFEPHKNTHPIYEEKGELYYADKPFQGRLAKLSVIREKVAGYINSSAFKKESSENLQILLKNVKILNEKFESHNRFRSYRFSWLFRFIFRLLGYEIKPLATIEIELHSKSQEAQLPVIKITTRIRTSTFVGKGVSDKLAKHLTTLDGKPLQIPPTAFRVEVMAVGNNNIFPLYFALPSTLFDGLRQGDEICLCYDGKPVKLSLSHSPDRQGNKLPFEKALETIKKSVYESLFIHGGFEEGDSDDEIVVKELLKNSKVMTLLEESRDAPNPQLSWKALEAPIWKAIRESYLNPLWGQIVTEFTYPTCQPSVCRKDGEAKYYEFYFTALDLQHNTLQLVATEDKILILGKLCKKQLEPGEQLFPTNGQPSARKECLSFNGEKILPESLHIEFDDRGQFILKVATT